MVERLFYAQLFICAEISIKPCKNLTSKVPETPLPNRRRFLSLLENDTTPRFYEKLICSNQDQNTISPQDLLNLNTRRMQHIFLLDSL